MQMDIHPQIITKINGYEVSTVAHTGCNETMVFDSSGESVWVDFHKGTKMDMVRSHLDGVEWVKSQETFRKSNYAVPVTPYNDNVAKLRKTDIHTAMEKAVTVTISVADLTKALEWAAREGRRGVDTKETIARDTVRMFNLK